MRNKIPLSEMPIWVLILFLPFFMSSIYLLFSTIDGLKPRFFGERVKATVMEVDSVSFNRKSNQNTIYRYYGNVKFEYRDQQVVSKYELEKRQKTGDDMALYYHGNYGFYNPDDQNLAMAFLVLFSTVLSVLSYVYYSYFGERFGTK